MIRRRDDGWGARSPCILYHRGVSVANYWRLGVSSHAGSVKDDYTRMNVFWCATGDADPWNVATLVFGTCDDERLCLLRASPCFDTVSRPVADGRMRKSLSCSRIHECNPTYSGFAATSVPSERAGIVLVEGENECQVFMWRGTVSRQIFSIHGFEERN